MRQLHNFSLVVFASAICSVANADSLCNTPEETFFSCKISGTDKLVSLCGNALSEEAGFWLQYRFGSHKHLELAYPPSHGKNHELFSANKIFVGYHRRSNGFDTEVKFRIGSHRYTVFEWMPGEGEQVAKYGVFVSTTESGPGKELACSSIPEGKWASLAQRYGRDE